MPLPNNGWLPAPLGQDPVQFTLPETYQVYYYVCNPGPYDPAQPWQKPVIEYITINQQPFADAGWKRGAWGWVAGIHWSWAYGDALIDAVWPPDEPTSDDEHCPGNDDVTDDGCPPLFILAVDTRETETLTIDTRVAPSIAVTRPGEVTVTPDVRVAPTFKDDDKPA